MGWFEDLFLNEAKASANSRAPVSDEKIEAAIDEYLEENPVSACDVTVDPTLTESGKAADAKVTGDRLNAVEYQTVTTDAAYKHTDLPEGEKIVTIQGDDVFGTTAIVGNFTNLIPSGGFSVTFPFRGITMAKKGDGYTVSGTSTELSPSFYFIDSEGNHDIPISADLIGKTLIHAVFADSISGNVALSVRFLNESKTQISKVSAPIKTAMKEVVVPDGTAYINVQFYCQPNIEYNHEFKYYLVEKDKCQTVTLNENIAEIQGVTDTAMLSVPYKSTAKYIVSLRELIDDYAGGGNVTYLTPEDFGAVGDGATDDSAAIAECLDMASETGKTVIMAGQYFIASPITITQSGLEIICNDIVYSGTDYAVKIIGRENKIKIHSIVSNGVGLAFEANGQKSTSYNSVEVNTITAQSHGLAFYKGSSFAHQNTVKFELIRAGGTGCYGICFVSSEEHPSSFIAECNLYGGQIANCEWAVYDVGGNSRCYGFEIEEEVQGGFYTTSSGGLIVFHPRHAEGSRDGTLPFFKFTGVENVHLYLSSPLAINEIDLSDAIDTFTANTAEFPVHEGKIAIINGVITSRFPAVETNSGHPLIYTTKAYIWGKYLIMTPYMAYRKEVTTETLDTRLIGRTDETEAEIEALSQLPTKFIVGTVNSDIYLHSSYCAFGFNKFEIEQKNGFTCKVYDVLGNLIFDGTELGDGLYRLSAYKDADLADANGHGLIRRDFTGHYWEVTKSADTVI